MHSNAAREVAHATVIHQTNREIVVLGIAVAREVFVETFIFKQRSTNDHIATIE